TKQYSFTDKKLNNGTYEYRLKQIDYNGSFHYSDVISTEVLYVTSFQLEQNFPNPFNPSTKIRYNIPESGFVNLSVYNLLGEKIAELVNETKIAGEYEVNFTADGIPSGIYIAKVSSGEISQSIKMTLLK
ncbi:MAG: T9SS type A sorting domain-containing protein, partial [Ignavibacteriales bacterium]